MTILFDAAHVNKPARFGFGLDDQILSVDVPRDEPTAAWWPELKAMLTGLGYPLCNRYAIALWAERRGVVDACPAVDREDVGLVNELVGRSIALADLKPVRKVNRDTIAVNSTLSVSPINPVPSPLPLPKRPAPRPRPFMPSKEDSEWWAAESDRIEKDRERLGDNQEVAGELELDRHYDEM